ncbi:type II toxin-antitoxin system HicB family antitoxin [Zooshikella sp. RANM57]|uniref:type II toxin-antitoxin system HicB family antitoxin n=1 Tax=Zooshikella sp. RANM57 TaxID=3425863 RepID=UPI003D6E1B9E
MKYPVVLHTDDGINYGVTVPDIPGCFSAGEGIEEALQEAVEAIEGHLEILVEDGEQVPVATAINKHQANSDYEGGIWALVEVDITPYLGKAERINVTLPGLLIKHIDEFVALHPEYKSRSGFLAAVAQDKLLRPESR